MQMKFSICKQKILKVPFFLLFSNLTYNILHNVYLFSTKNEYLSIAPSAKQWRILCPITPDLLSTTARLWLDNDSTMNGRPRGGPAGQGISLHA